MMKKNHWKLGIPKKIYQKKNECLFNFNNYLRCVNTSRENEENQQNVKVS